MKKRLQVTGTPTIFLDGMWDRQRKDLEKYAREEVEIDISTIRVG